MSTMSDGSVILHRRIAARVRALRTERAMSLDALAKKCGVSRSMISLIERGESSPTAVVLDRLAAGLGVTLSALFDTPPSLRTGDERLARCAEQPEWRDPSSGYRRRNVSPPDPSQPMRIVEVSFPPRARVAFETGARDARVFQQVWVLAGAMDVTAGSARHRLTKGDCLAMTLDAPTVFFNPGARPARYVVVTCEVPRNKR